MNMSTPYVIETQGLSKTYKNVQALQPLNLKVQQNSIFWFLGPNGAGKTTTIKLLLGLIRPTACSARIFGMDTIRQSVDIRTRIGYLPQEPHFYEYMTARETLRFVASCFFTGPKKAIEERIDEMLEMVNLTDKADRPIKTFSGGERQRLCIAQAQVNYPDLLILDDVQRVSDTVVILDKGQLVAQGLIEELLAGSEGVVYLVHLKGEVETARQRILSQPWVSSIISGQYNSHTTWQVSVSDPQAAEVQLFKLLATDSVVVTEFRRKQYELEDVFMQVIEGGSNGRK